MTARHALVLLKGAAAVGTLGLLLAGCAYDYLQRTDRVAYSAGDAVKANLEAETIDPENPASRKTTGLGKNGVLIRPVQAAAEPAAP
jgi:hypothetical protein